MAESFLEGIRRAGREAAARQAPKPAPKRVAPKKKVKPRTVAPQPTAPRQYGPAVPAPVMKRNRAAYRARMRAKIAADRAKAAGSRDPVIAAGDAIAARAARNASRPRGDVANRLRAEYAGVSGPQARLLGIPGLTRISDEADPLINFTEKVTRPLTTPTSVAGSLIDADPANAAKQLVSATYWGKQNAASAALTRRGILPETPMGQLLGIGADVGASLAIPGFKTIGRGRASLAARAVSRDQRLPRGTTERVPHQQTTARLPGKKPPRQQRAVRLNPARGPDIITRPKANVVRPRSVAPGATAATRPRPAVVPPRRNLSDVPYPPSARAQRAVDRLEAARANYEALTARPATSRVQIARAGEALGRARAQLAAAERATIGRIRGTAPVLTRTQRTQIEARLPGAATSAGRRSPSLIGPRRGPDLQTPAATPRAKAPRAPKPKDVPYTGIGVAARALDEVKAVAQKLVTVRSPKPEALTFAGETLGRAKAAVEAAQASGTGASPAAFSRLTRAIDRAESLQSATRGGPLPRTVLAVGRELEAATTAYRAEVATVQRAIVGGRRALRGNGGTPTVKPTARQLRAAEPAKGRSVFDTRPHTVNALRSSDVVPMEGTRLPKLRSKVNEATGKVEHATRPEPTPKQVGKAGKKLAKAEARVQKIHDQIWAPKRGKTTKREPTLRQEDIHRDNFTGSREREWIDANMDYEATVRAEIAKAPLGVNITLPFRYDKKGLNIPVTSVAMANKIRAAFSNGPLGEALTAYRLWVVSRYGPNPVVRMGALAADDVARMQMGRSSRFIVDATKAAGLSEKELALASHWLEGTTPRGVVVPQKVKDYALKMAEFTERNLDEFLQAGGQVKRFGSNGKLDGGLDRQYVYHMLPAGEWDRFAVSALARRQMLYGKTPGFIKHREILTIRDLKAAGFHPEENLAKLTLARAMAHHRAMAEMELSRSVARRFGKPTKDAPDDWARIPSQFTNEDVMVPADVAKTLSNVIEARLALSTNKASQKLQQANQRWKEWALFTTGHDIRNQVGDSMLVFQQTMNPVAPLMAFTYGAKLLTGKGKTGGKSGLTSKQARLLSEVSGNKEAGLFGGDILANVASVESHSGVVRPRSFKRPMRAVHGGVRKARTGREALNRGGVMARELRKGEGAVHSGRVAKDTLFDYGDVGKGVHWARRSPIGAPFITWTAKNLPNQIKLGVTKPGQLAAQLTALEGLGEIAGDYPGFLKPDWLRNRVPIPVPGYGNVDVSLPVADLNKIPTDINRLGDTAREWYSQLGPVGQTPIALFGKDPMTGQDFQDVRPSNPVERQLQQIPLLQPFLGPPTKVLRRDETGEKRPVPAVNTRGAWALQQVSPGVSTAGRLAGGTGSRSWLDTIRGPVFGHTRRDFASPREMDSLARSISYRVEMELKPEFNRRLKAVAPNWRRGDPIPNELRGKYNEIIRLTKQYEWLTEALRRAPVGAR